MGKRKHHRIVIGRRGLLYSIGLCLLIMGFGGIGFWLLEPRVETLSDGLWLAFTTAATVGYGDIIPSTHASRAFSVLVVMLGLAVFSLVTASVAALLVEVEEREIERDLLQEIGNLRAEVRELRNSLQPRHGQADGQTNGPASNTVSASVSTPPNHPLDP